MTRKHSIKALKVERVQYVIVINSLQLGGVYTLALRTPSSEWGGLVGQCRAQAHCLGEPLHGFHTDLYRHVCLALWML